MRVRQGGNVMERQRGSEGVGGLAPVWARGGDLLV